MKKTTLVLTGIILVSSIYAQPGARRNPKANCGPDKMMMDRGERGENREEMMAFKLTERLELTSEQADKFFPRFREHREEMKAIGKEVAEARDGIRDKLKDDKEISDSELNKVLNKVNSLHIEKDEARFKFINSLDDILDNNQIAIFAMAPKDLQHKQMMKRDKRPQKRHK